ncbi:MAG TPA: Rrf2 family transcriptional regulator [Tetragenococcus sp.]|nr:Rrf2 family transcriptional regulator [Tetragenococcus sp.]
MSIILYLGVDLHEKFHPISDAVHILAYIAIFKNTNCLSSTAIRNSVKTNPSNIRKIMGLLKKAQLIQTINGQTHPTLNKNVNTITLYDIYKSLENKDDLFLVDTTTDQKCVIGGNIQKVLQEEYDHLQAVV